MSFTIFNGFNFGKVQTQNVSAGGGAVGGWVELGRATASGTPSVLTVSSIPDKRYYQVLYYDKGVVGANARLLTFNNDSGSNYSRRYSDIGGADVTATSQSNHNGWGNNNTTPQFAVMYHSNYATKEKLSIIHHVGQLDAGAGNAPRRVEFVGKWTNTSNAINRIDVTTGAETFTSGDEIVVLGYDPSDTHTTNFWEELDTKENTTGSTSTFTSNTFTAKKYLWIQCFIKNGSASARNALFRFNGDSGSNYAHRRSQNGGADSTQTSQSNGIITDGFTNETGFVNMFIINNSANEKLAICHSTFSNTSGAGVAPNRSETVSKWITTGSQITSFSLIDTVSSDAFANGSIIKVYGSN